MKKQTSAYEELEKIANEALGGIVRPQALGFVLSALDTSLRGLRQRRHISGQELCKAVRDLAAREYGLMVREVLNAWGIDSTETIGRIVFALVDAGKMTKTDEDTLADFSNVFDFEEAFSPAAILKATRTVRTRTRRRPS
ncbi:MAG: hypothetical protein A3G34_12790 [Candidatus Lindowbacteria bacterium RIFCSPLOWO2_12_FULL_62_27]|nr:MAG: hypothetical protein A3I06_15275 [Candidatus Lindowbacteria bacterium RIFCSPLOWO2_02_FULL_62_12]OGH62471.1 MAG: hypothetical protein A3G34_12790 [Candidatus Lindowbacteria bacterium RIFCSPLOWO2_12_FULL_62_27]